MNEVIPVIVAALTAVLVGVVQMIKDTAIMDSKWVPYAALAIGVIAGMFTAPLFGATLYLGAIAGFVAGLASAGYYKAVKASKEE